MISIIIENTLVFLSETPITYFLSLLVLHLLLLILLVTRRKKRGRAIPNDLPDKIPGEVELEELELPIESDRIDQEADHEERARHEVKGRIEPEEEAPLPKEKSVPKAVLEQMPKPQKEPFVAQHDNVSRKTDTQQQSTAGIEPVVETPLPGIKAHIDATPTEVQTDSAIEATGETPTKEVPLPIDKKAEKAEKPARLFTRLKTGLSKTRKFLNTDIDQFFAGRKKIDDELLEDLEELLITADIGVQTTMDLIERISKRSADITDADQLKNVLKSEIQSLIKMDAQDKTVPPDSTVRPHVIMVVGVNGVGKTTTIGKLAAHYRDDNKKVLIAAADTFRAAAVEQVKIWADRCQADLVCHQDGSDPAAVAFDGVEAGIARDCDVVIIDTAGRLHTKTNLMEELKKIKRSVHKRLEGAPHEILLVLDATTGQNAVTQAEIFNEALDLDAIALTKLDGTAKGGIVVSIVKSLNIPLKYIGVGEHINDFQKFDPKKFVDALF